MASRTAWILAAALACAPPASAMSLLCEQGTGPKPEQGARGAEGRGQDGRAGAEGKGPESKKEERRVPWWKAPETRAELGISDKQSKDIDDIFQATLPSLRAAKDELDKLDEALAKL